jgi:hypothetical protein
MNTEKELLYLNQYVTFHCTPSCFAIQLTGAYFKMDSWGGVKMKFQFQNQGHGVDAI